MQKFDMSLMEYERILRKQYKMILLCIVLVMLSSFFFMRSKTKLFRAFSSVQIDKRAAESGLIPDTYWDNMETQVLVVTSFPVMELVAQETGLLDSNAAPGAIKTNERQIRLVNDLASKVSAKIRGNSTIIDITVVSSNAREAKALANAVAVSYKKFSKREKGRTAMETRLFIEKQLDICKQELVKYESQLKDLMQKSTYPTIDEKMRSTLDLNAALQKENRDLDGRISAISEEMGDLEKRRNWPYFNIKDKESKDEQRPYMDWVSGTGEVDAGLEQLNQKLLDLELRKSELLNFYKVGHPNIVNIEQEIGNIIAQITREYNSRVSQYRKKYNANLEEIAKLDAVLSQTPGEQLLFSQIQRNIAMNAKLYDLLATKYQMALITEASSADEVVVLSYAVTPNMPFNVNNFKILIISLVIGIMLGIMAALILETFDTSIGTIEDVENYLQIPVIAVIPHIKKESTLEIIESRAGRGIVSEDFHALHLVTHFDPKSPDAESYRSLRTNIQFLDIYKNIKVIGFTSSVMREGKSTTITNLAVAMAQAGLKTLYMGCNLRRPTDYKIFGLPMGPGVCDILIEKDKWQDCVRTVKDSEYEILKHSDLFGVPGIENLNIITCGGIPPNPSELLQSKNMDKLIAEVRQHYDIVLIDAPPTLPVTDSSILGTKVDGMVVVYQTGRVPRNALKRAKIKLESVNSKLLGLILNDTKSEMSGYFTGYYKYYVDDKGMRKKKKKNKASYSVKGLLFTMASGGAGAVLLRLVRSQMFLGLLGVAIISSCGWKALSFKRSAAEAGTAVKNIRMEAEAPAAVSVKAPSLAPVAPMQDAKVRTEKAGRLYFVQFSSWQTQEQAERICMDLNVKKDINARVRPYVVDGQVRAYRVGMGEFASLESARQSLERVSAAASLKDLIVNYESRP